MKYLISNFVRPFSSFHFLISLDFQIFCRFIFFSIISFILLVICFRLPLFIIFSSSKKFSIACILFCVLDIFYNFHLFYILENFLFVLLFVYYFSFHLHLFFILKSFCTETSQFWLKIRFIHLFFIFRLSVSKCFSFFVLVVSNASLFHLIVFFVFRLYFLMKNVVLHRFFIAPGGFLFLLLVFSGFWFLRMCR